MDIATCLQHFENSLSSYSGDDPLDQWDKFVGYLDENVPAEGQSWMSVVFDSLVKYFLNEPRYYNDDRYINHCIRCASFYPDPSRLFSHLHGKGVGVKAAGVYVAWAKCLETNGMLETADSVYKKGMENHATPAQLLDTEHRQFQARTRSQTPSMGSRAPLQNSQLPNQMASHQEPVAQTKTVDCPPEAAGSRTVTTVSRSETSSALKSRSSQQQTVIFVSQYLTEGITSGDTEFSFEELRAQRYFQKKREEQDRARGESYNKCVEEVDKGSMWFKNLIQQPVMFGSIPSSNLNPTQSAYVSAPPTSLSGLRFNSAAAAHGLFSTVREKNSFLLGAASTIPENKMEASCLHTPAAEEEEGEEKEEEERGQKSTLVGESETANGQMSTVPMSQYGATANLSHTSHNLSHTSHNLSHITPNAILTGTMPASLSHNLSHINPSTSVAANLSHISPSLSHITPSLSHITPNTFLTGTMPANLSHTSPSLSHFTPDTSTTTANLSHHINPNTNTSVYATNPSHNLSHTTHNLSHTTPSLSHFTPNIPMPADPSHNLSHNLSHINPSHISQNLSHINPITSAAANLSHTTPNESMTANLSHITPNSSHCGGGGAGAANLSHSQSLSHSHNLSMGYVQATPSRVMPSPTVNTREALDVIMDMFQAPTLLEDRFNTQTDTSYIHTGGSVKPAAKQTQTAGFTIFQDNCDQENGSVAMAAATSSFPEKPQPIRALAEIPVANKVNSPPPEALTPDESTLWMNYNTQNSVAACPNSTSDFAMLAQCVSTPFTHKTHFYPDTEETCDGTEAEEDAFMRRQTKKLSPILEQSPSDPSSSISTAVRNHNHTSSSATSSSIIIKPHTHAHTHAHSHTHTQGEGTISHTHNNSTVTMVMPPPPAGLSFRDHTHTHTHTIIGGGGGGGGGRGGRGGRGGGGLNGKSMGNHEPFTIMEDFGDEEERERNEQLTKPKSEPFTIMEDCGEEEMTSPQKERNEQMDVPMSPPPLNADWSECEKLKFDWPSVRSPEKDMEADLDLDSDLDVFLSPRHNTHTMSMLIPMSPCLTAAQDDPMMTPEKTQRYDVSMNATPGPHNHTQAVATGMNLVFDPWDDDLIAGLLANQKPPLTSHPRCISWQCNTPNISPKTTISMGKSSMRVDSVLGRGAFATVYQATDPLTSDKVVLKVQKPANPWEFYINTVLDARLSSSCRHLYSNIRSSHLFSDGSVMVGDLHGYGTLLNAVNLYKTQSDKLMPQPLVLYFSVCILSMLERLHEAQVIHADIKPDNFMLGERFLDNRSFSLDSLDHGLVLIDMGQSVDMTLFPACTAFTGQCKTSGFQCTEMLSGRPWNYQTDLFGLAGTVYCMLFGSYMEVKQEDGVWKTNGSFRRNPHADLWQRMFHSLLNVPDCDSLPDLRALRSDLGSVLTQTYSNKLASLKSRLVVLLLENRKR